MKLATYKDGSRDGQLVVVSRDLSTAHYATGVASQMRQVLDDWNFMSPQLQDVYVTLNQGKARHAFAFDPRMCMAPVPRTHHHVTAPDPARWAWADAVVPVLCPLPGDGLLGPTDDVVLPREDTGVVCGGGLAVVTGDLPLGATPDTALEAIRLLMLCNEWVLRHGLNRAGAHGGLASALPATAFGPVAVTPDELGEAWSGGRLARPVQTRWRGGPMDAHEAGPARWHVGQVLAQACAQRGLRSGTVVCVGAGGSEPLTDATPSEGLRWGDTVHVELLGRDGLSVFGAIEQTLAPPA